MKKLKGDFIKSRVLHHIRYLFSGKTVREISKITHYSKTTVYKDLTTRAEILYPEYTEKIKKILSLNYDMRGFRGVNSRNLQYKDTEKLKDYQKIFKEILK